MRNELFALRTKHLAIVAAGALVGGLMIAGSQAVAQPSGEITVVAPRAVVHKQVGTTGLGIPIEQVTLTRHVGYGDLNLATPAGAAALDARVRHAAKEACEQLDTLYPAALYPRAPHDKDCFKTAVDGGIAQAKLAIAAAAR